MGRETVMTASRHAVVAEAIREAVGLHQLGRLDVAAQLYAAILEVQPDHFDALHLLGVLSQQRGESEEAQRLLEAALAVNPASADAQSNYGLMLHSLERHDEALARFDRALALDARHVGAHVSRADTLRALGRLEEALASFDRALALEPDLLDALVNRSSVLQKLGRFAEALAGLDRAVALRPGMVEVVRERANVLKALERFDEALAAYDGVLALGPADAKALVDRGIALESLGRPVEALFSYTRAVAAEPRLPAANFNEALTRLRLGDFSGGWPKYEWRWEHPELKAARRPFAQPLWRGEPLAGRTILLHAEQGLGDTIQMARYAPLVAAKGGRVILEVQPPLRPLLEGLGVTIVSRGEALPAFDLHCPLLSLPWAFATELATIPADVPYLRAADDRVARWRERLPEGPRVGLAWSGSAIHHNDRKRSIPLARLAPLFADPRLRFVSLQRDLRPEDAETLRGLSSVVHVGDALSDFADTAAVVSQLDLVISVDTATAHLAGSLGKPVWILLPFVPDWRWMLEREDSPWYPTARLFRQPALDDWASVIARVGRELDSR